MRPSSEVRGIEVDLHTRCAHYHSVLDIIAIKMKCCGVYYACKDCHDSLAGHSITRWPVDEWNEKAILCGKCQIELSIKEYLGSDSSCPNCNGNFNPGCRNHYQFYFEMKADDLETAL